MASHCWSLNSNHSIRTASSSVLIQRHTTVTPLFNILLLSFTKYVLNPIKTCQMRKNNLRKTKTDKIDTYVIAKTPMIQDNLRFVNFFILDMMDLKTLGRFRQKTIKQRTRLKIQLTIYVDQVFPEIQYFFNFVLHQHAVYALLKEVPSLKELTFMHTTHLINLLKVNSHEHFTKEQVKEVTTTSSTGGLLLALLRANLSESSGRCSLTM